MSTKLNNGQLSLALSAYNKVFGTKYKSVKEMPEDIAESYIPEAPKTVATYEGLFKGETEEGAQKRDALKSARLGKVADLATYFKSLYPEWEKRPSWEIVMEMRKSIDTLSMESATSKTETLASEEKDTTSPTDTNVRKEVELQTKDDSKESETKEILKSETESNPGSGSSHNNQITKEVLETKPAVDEDTVDLSNINNNKSKETKEMATKAIEELANEAVQQNGTNFNVGMQGDKSLPTQPSAAMNKAAAEKIKEGKTAARDYYASHRIDKALLPNFTAKELLVNGEKAKGYVRNPEKALADFQNKLGVKKDETTGLITFTELESQDLGSTSNAEAIYNILVAAAGVKEGNSAPVDMNISDKYGQFKALHISNMKAGADAAADDGQGWFKWVEVPAVLADKAHGGLETTDSSITFALHKAKPRTNTKKDKKGTQSRSAASANPYSGVTTVRCNEKDEAIKAIGLNVKKKLSDTEVGGRFSSVASCVYIATRNEDGTYETKTYRIPLKAEIYKTEDNKEDAMVAEYLNKYGASKRTIEKYNFEDAQANPDTQAMLRDVMVVMAKTGTDATSQKIKAMAEAAEQEEAQNQANQMANAGVETEDLD